MLCCKNGQRWGEHKPLHSDNIKYVEIKNCAHSGTIWYLVMCYLWFSSNLRWVLQSPSQYIWRLKSPWQLSLFFGTSDDLTCFQGGKNSSSVTVSVGTVWSIYVIGCKHLTYLSFKTSEIWGQCSIKKETVTQCEYRQIAYKSVSQKLQVCNICQSQTSQT